MSLSIGVHKGSKIMVGASLLEVKNVFHGAAVEITIDHKPFRITEEGSDVLPDVFICYFGSKTKGEGGEDLEGARLSFDAPRKIRIKRI